ncbi:MAG: ATP-dependent Clp protease adaptor ClpS [Phycisphaerales bacterium]|nr:ATP-dependent Clp protease adaptor ClpS [Phycisphaerales bacterium]
MPDDAPHTTGASSAAVAPAKPQTRRQPQTRHPPLWNVVLLDDDEHTYDYVIDLACKLFGHSEQKAFLIAKAVDKQGRAILLTTHREHAELKLEQVQGFGADPRMSACKGAMTCILEPAIGGGDDDGEPPAKR